MKNYKIKLILKIYGGGTRRYYARGTKLYIVLLTSYEHKLDIVVHVLKIINISSFVHLTSESILICFFFNFIRMSPALILIYFDAGLNVD